MYYSQVTDSQTYAWILLSIPEDGGRFREVMSIADGINHAVPTHYEMQRSLRWLTNHGLVEKKGRILSLTARSRGLLAEESATTMMQTWDRVAAKLEQLDRDESAQ